MLEYSCLTMLCLPFDVFSKVIQLHAHIYSLFFKPISCLGCHGVLSRAGVSHSRSSLVLAFKRSTVHSPGLPACPPLPTLPPGIRKFIL